MIDDEVPISGKYLYIYFHSGSLKLFCFGKIIEFINYGGASESVVLCSHQ